MSDDDSVKSGQAVGRTLRAFESPAAPDLAAVKSARERFGGLVRATPLVHAAELSERTGFDIYLKLENLQRTGAFKLRGALARLTTLTEAERGRGVVTASAGNHGRGVAVAARLLGCPVCVVLPIGAPLAKLTAIQAAGAEVVQRDQNYDDCHNTALAIAAARGMVYVHAFDDPTVVAGQGTVGLEMLEAQPDLDVIVAPVGGGGLLSGIAVATRGVGCQAELVGVQAERADAAARSFAAGRPVTADAITIADGIAVKRPGALTMAILRRYIARIVTVSDEAIARAIVLLLEELKFVAEGAGAAALAAVCGGLVGAPGAKVGVVVSGGNIDGNLMTQVIQHGMASAGRYLAMTTWLEDRPGELQRISTVLGAHQVNILHVGHRRLGPFASLGRVELELIVETRDRGHALSVLELMRGAGYTVAEQHPSVEPLVYRSIVVDQ